MHIDKAMQLKSYERIAFILHRHSLTFIPTVILFLILFAVPIIVYFLLTNLFPDLFLDNIVYPIGVLLGSVYFLSTYLFFYVRFLDYYLDVWVVTNDRIIDIEQQGLFHRVITELELFNIQDVTVTVAGFFATIFNYGDITITTASHNAHIIFHQVTDPNHVRQELIKLADEDRRYHHRPQ